MRALLALAALLALLGPALIVEATLGDNGLTTYTGRTREPNTLVFGNEMVSEQAWEGTLSLTKDILKGTWKPLKNDPPTEKKEVSSAECRVAALYHPGMLQARPGSIGSEHSSRAVQQEQSISLISPSAAGQEHKSGAGLIE